MKKFLLLAFSALLAVSVSATGTGKKLSARYHAAGDLQLTQRLPMSNVLSALHDNQSYKVPNFYMMFSDNEQATYNSNTGDITAPEGSYALTLDLYNQTPDDGIYLPAGTYNKIDDNDPERAFGYYGQYSMLDKFTKNGRETVATIEEPIEVSITDGQYTISTSVTDPVTKQIISVTFRGPIAFTSPNERPTVYPQIKHDVNVNLNKGGISYYQGVTDVSSQGVSYLDLYDVDFDKTTGVMNGEGYSLCMMIAHKRFTKRSDYAVCPGTYTPSNSLSRNTWYPGREIDYMGYVMYFGSYIRHLKIENGQRSYTYAYLKTGEFTIEDNGDGTYKGTLNAVSDLGYKITATWNGAIALNTDNATFEATISDLTDDVEMDFSPLEFGRIYHGGLMGGCRRLIVDLGSPTGKDEAITNGGDLLRMEFLVDPKEHLLKPGLYTVVPRRWNSNELAAGGTYEPMSLNKGYFDGNGAQIGTRYAHFRTGSYCVYDMVGPAEEGTVRVETDDFVNYKFDIDLKDDAGFMMTGKWDKPLEYNYDAEALHREISGIDNVSADESPVRAIIEGSNLFIINAGNAPVAVYDIAGRLIVSTTADRMIPVADLGKGMFIIKVNNTTIKITL